ncbi:MAG: hypothetical protein ACRD28_01735 [Acidobacteriaceae bacterium]
MKLFTYFGTSLAAGAFLLAGTLALAQTTSAARNMQPRDAAGVQSSGQKTQSGHAAGLAVNEHGSRGHNGMAAKSIAVDHAGGNGVQRMADDKTTGVNPLYESKDKMNSKPNTGASKVEPYKDGEDMTTRYRPGNNKTTINSIAVDHAGGNGVRRMDRGQNAGTSSNLGSSAETQKKKHLAGVKYQDRTSGGGNNARGLAVNEQGSSSAPVRRRR